MSIFVSDIEPKRITLKCDPGEWIEIKPLRGADSLDLRESGTAERLAGVLLKAVCAWSYEKPLSVESFLDMRGDAFNEIIDQIKDATFVTEAARKNGSGA